jgi:hypothetical protein
MTRPSNELSATNRAFLALICAVVWLIFWPVGFVRGFRKALRASDESDAQGADWGCETQSIPNVNILHNDNAGAAK